MIADGAPNPIRIITKAPTWYTKSFEQRAHLNAYKTLNSTIVNWESEWKSLTLSDFIALLESWLKLKKAEN